MNKGFLIFRHEFAVAVKKPGFSVITLIVPVAGLAAIGLAALAMGGQPIMAPSAGSPMGGVVAPGLFALLMALALVLGSASLINALAEEKESRLVEVLFSSVSVRQLLFGKLAALGLAGLLQVIVWLVSIPLLLDLASSAIGGFMSTIPVPDGFIILGIVYFILAYLLFSVLSIGIGAISTNATEGNQLSMIYSMTAFIPLWFFALLGFFPNSPIWVVLSFIPTTAPIQVMVRIGLTGVPLWQIFVSLSILLLSVLAAMAVTVRVFRVYMLVSGKRPSLKEISRTLRDA